MNRYEKNPKQNIDKPNPRRTKIHHNQIGLTPGI